jgi:exopolysaccharide production protein ExoZ
VRSYITGFDYLRGVAALMVVVHHVVGVLSHETLPGHFFWVGASGVDIFFVLSGFLMYGILGGKASVRGFLLSRATRVVPTYFIVSTFYLLVSVFVLHRGFEAESWRFIKSILFIPHLNRDGMIQPIVGAGWTLTYEVWFYAFTALCLACGRFGYFCFWCIPAFLVGALIFPNETVIYKFLTSPVIFEFWFGAFVRQLLSMWSVGCKTSVAVLLLGVSALITDHFLDLHAGIGRLLVWGVPAAFIVFGAAGLQLKPNSVSAWFARTSYPVYLIHTILVIAFARFVGGSSTINQAYVLVVAVLVFLGSYTLAHYFERFVERPVMATLKFRFGL